MNFVKSGTAHSPVLGCSAVSSKTMPAIPSKYRLEDFSFYNISEILSVYLSKRKYYKQII